MNRSRLEMAMTSTLHSTYTRVARQLLDALPDTDLDAMASVAASRVGRFGSVEAIGAESERLAAALRRYATRGPVLLAAAVLGESAAIEEQRGGRDAVGTAIFALGEYPAWVRPVFVAGERIQAISAELTSLQGRLRYWQPSASEAIAALDELGAARNDLLLHLDAALERAALVDEAAALLLAWQQQGLATSAAAAQDEPLPLATRRWLAAFDGLDSRFGC
jgi:hypothetical protein